MKDARTRFNKVIFICLFVVLSSIEVSAFTIAENGSPETKIVVLSGSPAVVTFAGEELKKFLDAMTGASFEIVSTIPPSGNAIILGDCAAAQSAGIDVDTIDRDGYHIKNVSNHLFIAGKDDATISYDKISSVYDDSLPWDASWTAKNEAFGFFTWAFERGTLHGVYRLLEELGVRWFLPGSKGMVVPEHDDLSVGAVNWLEEPDFAYFEESPHVWWPSEANIASGAVDVDEWNDLEMSGRAQQLWLMRMRASTDKMGFSHRPPKHQWESRFSGSHPEYFYATAGGGRNYNWLCYSSAGMLSETEDDIAAFFDDELSSTRGISSNSLFLTYNQGWNPTASFGDWFSLLPNDGFKKCTCAICSSKTDSELIWGFVDEVAGDMISEYPNKNLICLAYGSYMDPPASSLPDNVTVGIAFLQNGLGYPSKLVNLDNNNDFFDALDDWSTKTNNPLFFWLYYLHRRSPEKQALPMHLPQFQGDFFEDIIGYGNRVFIERDGGFMFEHLNIYAACRLRWNSSEDISAILADYYTNYYGAAAASMSSVISDIESKCENIAENTKGVVHIWNNEFNAETLNGYYETVESAYNATSDSTNKEHIALFRDYFLQKMIDGRQTWEESCDRDNAVTLKEKFDDNSNGWDNIGTSSGEATIGTDPGPTSETVWYPSNSNGIFVKSLLTLSEMVDLSDGIVEIKFSVRVDNLTGTDYNNLYVQVGDTGNSMIARLNIRSGSFARLVYRYPNTSSIYNHYIDKFNFNATDEFETFKLRLVKQSLTTMDIFAYYYDKNMETYVFLGKNENPCYYATGVINRVYVYSRNCEGNYRAYFNDIQISQTNETQLPLENAVSETVEFKDDFHDNANGWSNIGASSGQATIGEDIADNGRHVWYPSNDSDNISCYSTETLSAALDLDDGPIRAYIRVRTDRDTALQAARFYVVMADSASSQWTRLTISPGENSVVTLSWRNLLGQIASLTIQMPSYDISPPGGVFTTFCFKLTKTADNTMDVEGLYYDIKTASYISLGKKENAYFSTGCFDKITIFNRNADNIYKNNRAYFDLVAITQE